MLEQVGRFRPGLNLSSDECCTVLSSVQRHVDALRRAAPPALHSQVPHEPRNVKLVETIRRRRVSEWFLNGTSAHKRLFRAIEVIMEVKTNLSNQ